MAICNQQADIPLVACGLVSDLMMFELKEYNIVYDAEYPYLDSALLNNIKGTIWVPINM